MQTEYKNYRQQGFCVRRAEVQNSTLVFQLNFSNKTSFCASISRPNAKPQNVVCNLRARKRERLMQFEINFVHNIKNNLNKRNIL